MRQSLTEMERDQVSEEKRYALDLLSEAFAEGRLEGLDPDCLAQAAIFAGFQELVATYGEDAAADFAETITERVRSGGFSTAPKH